MVPVRQSATRTMLESSGAHMRLLDKYIGREVGSHAALGLAVFTFVFFVPQLVRLMDLIVRHSGGIGMVLLIFLCSLIPVLAFTIPMAVLVGVLIGLGRLSADSEIVALHASGISLRRLLVPIGCVALACGLGTLVLTFWLSPLSIRTLRGLEARLLTSQAPYAIQPRVFDERFPHLVLYVQDVEAAATRWRGVFLASSGQIATTDVTIAQGAQVVAGAEQNQIELHLGNGSTHEYDPRDPRRYNVTTFGESEIPVEISSPVTGPKTVALSDAERSVSQLLAVRGANSRDARVEFHRRIAFPAACLVFALLGVPIGVRPRRGGRAAGLILTLVLIGGYYFLFVTGAHMAQQGSIAPWAGIWAANVGAIILGLIFLRRIESIRRPNRILAWFDSLLRRSRPRQRREAEAAPIPVSNGPVVNGLAAKPAARHLKPAGDPVAFPMLVDVYLLQRFFYYFFVLLAGFVVIFDAFTQADSSTTRQYGGTGLGLPISSGLAELMGGRIGCTSEVGKGSTFSFTAPFAIRKAIETSELGELAPIAIPPLGPAEQQEVFRILIAEDSEDNLVLLEAYLKDRAFELDVAKNGKIAVGKMQSGNPHLVLMDVQMPVMDGLEATRVIRGWEVKTHAHPIPILALTAHAGEDAVRRSLEAGCTEHLTKPIKKTALLEAISRHIGGKIRITPPEGVEVLVPKYVANIRRGMDEILAGVDSNDYKIARRLGHQFKGTGEGYGFPEITRTGAAVEVAAMAEDKDEIRSQIQALALYLDRVEIVMAPA